MDASCPVCGLGDAFGLKTTQKVYRTWIEHFDHPIRRCFSCGLINITMILMIITGHVYLLPLYKKHSPGELIVLLCLRDRQN